MFTTIFSNGSYESNPPFVEEVMMAMSMHILTSLRRSSIKNVNNPTNNDNNDNNNSNSNSNPLSFAVIIPAWDDTPGYEILVKSEFYRDKMFLSKHRHSYKEGYQHRVHNSKQYRISEAASFVLFLQNEEASKIWPINKQLIREIEESFQQQPPPHQQQQQQQQRKQRY